MELMANMILLAVALATIANAAFMNNPVTLVTALATVANAGLVANSVTLAIAFATVATAKPVEFVYKAVDRGDGDCHWSTVCYVVRDDVTGDRAGYFDGCIHDPNNPTLIGDGAFVLALCDPFWIEGKRQCVVSLTELASGVALGSVPDSGEVSDEVKKQFPNAKAYVGYGPDHDGSLKWEDMMCRVGKMPTCKGLTKAPPNPPGVPVVPCTAWPKLEARQTFVA